jgi:isoamylase
VLACRARQQRNFLATLFLSQGVPMLLGGDEIGRTQGGNNNAYCQDNEISWYAWENADESLLSFTRDMIAWRAAHPVFRRRRWFEGRSIRGEEEHDIGWFRPDGTEMTDEDWAKGYAKTLGVFLNGDAMIAPGPRGERITDDSFYVVFNAFAEEIEMTVPASLRGRWVLELDTTVGFVDEGEEVKAGSTVTAAGRSVVVLRRVVGD